MVFRTVVQDAQGRLEQLMSLDELPELVRETAARLAWKETTIFRLDQATWTIRRI